MNIITKQQNNWQNYSYKIENLILTNKHIISALSDFNLKVVKDLSPEIDIFIMFKIKIDKGPYRNISILHRINLSEFKTLEEIFIENWSLKSSEYEVYKISNIHFTYFIIKENNLIDKTYQSKELLQKSDKNKSILLENGTLDSINFGGYKLPNTMDITKWGKCDFYNEYSEAVVYKNNSKGIFYIKLYDYYLEANLKINDKIILSYTDTLNDGVNLGSFTRKIKDHNYVYENNKLKYKSKLFNCKYITTKSCDIYLKEKFITMDLETRIINNKMEVFHISLYDGKQFTNYYLKDFISSEDMLKASILNLLIRKYHGYKVYLHNFSNFDGVFLLKHMANLTSNIEIIMKDIKIISLKIKYGNNKYNLTFRDSFLLLPSSLKKLAKSFNVEDKLNFPFKILNNVELDYKGQVPEYTNFENLNYIEYLEYVKKYNNSSWVLREEIQKYCEQDVKTLYLIIDKFNRFIFNLFRINAINYPTISSLSFAIYRSIFLKETKIPILTGELYNFIKKSYTGGAVDVFKPFAKKVYKYDVNSLYPYIMANYNMPVGNPTYWEGDISELDLNLLGFIETDVIAPKDLNIPFLQTKIKSKKGEFRTISPLGEWRGVYTTNEIKNSIELGYKFKFIRALTFSYEKIFTEFVNYFYELKKMSSRNSSDYIIAKLFLNSLSGRFALDPILDTHSLVNNNEIIELQRKYNIKALTPLGNNINLISYTKNNEKDLDFAPNVSIAISAMITSNARLWMYQFKNNKVLYTDTDSIDTTQLLNPKYIGDELGQFKLEQVFDEAVYLAPKVYGGINKNSEYIKIKGLKNPVSYKELKSLLHKNNSLKLSQEKWIKNLEEAHISIHDEIYTLMVTDNKRELVYDINNIFIDTKPLTLKSKDKGEKG